MNPPVVEVPPMGTILAAPASSRSRRHRLLALYLLVARKITDLYCGLRYAIRFCRLGEWSNAARSLRSILDDPRPRRSMDQRFYEHFMRAQDARRHVPTRRIISAVLRGAADPDKIIWVRTDDLTAKAVFPAGPVLQRRPPRRLGPASRESRFDEQAPFGGAALQGWRFRGKKTDIFVKPVPAPAHARRRLRARRRVAPGAAAALRDEDRRSLREHPPSTDSWSRPTAMGTSTFRTCTSHGTDVFCSAATGTTVSPWPGS